MVCDYLLNTPHVLRGITFHILRKSVLILFLNIIAHVKKIQYPLISILVNRNKVPLTSQKIARFVGKKIVT